MDTRSNNKKNNKEANQATKDFENCEKWPALFSQTSMDKSEELLEKLNQINSKMSRLESIPNQILIWQALSKQYPWRWNSCTWKWKALEKKTTL